MTYRDLHNRIYATFGARVSWTALRPFLVAELGSIYRAYPALHVLLECGALRPAKRSVTYTVATPLPADVRLLGPYPVVTEVRADA